MSGQQTPVVQVVGPPYDFLPLLRVLWTTGWRILGTEPLPPLEQTEIESLSVLAQRGWGDRIPGILEDLSPHWEVQETRTQADLVLVGDRMILFEEGLTGKDTLTCLAADELLYGKDQQLLYFPAEGERVVFLSQLLDENQNLVVEIVGYPDASAGAPLAIKELLHQQGIKSVVLNYAVPGGGAERVRLPLQSELWRMFREGVASPGVLDTICARILESDSGPLTQLLDAGPSNRATIAETVCQASSSDSRFCPPLDGFRGGMPQDWLALESSGEEMLVHPSGSVEAKRVLVFGTPHLVQLWQNELKVRTGGKVAVEGWALWDLESISDSALRKLEKKGPFDLVLDVFLARTEDRQQLLLHLLDSITPQGQLWVHTLSVPATVVVQVIPEEICAVGFGGLPLPGEPMGVELVKPRNSDASELNRAAELATALKMTAFEVADEPGAVAARYLAVAINATAFLVREGIISSLAEADRYIRDFMDWGRKPFEVADEIGLDTVEAVMVGLHAFLGEDRYRLCPDLTMRIESGQVGSSTGNGYYTA